MLGFANAYETPFAVFRTLGLAPVWLAAQPRAQMTLGLATAAHLELVDAARDARALQASFSVDPAGALARLQQGVPTEVGQQQRAVGFRVDEVVPLALPAACVLREGAPGDVRELAVEGHIRAYANPILLALGPVHDPQHFGPHGASFRSPCHSLGSGTSRRSR